MGRPHWRPALLDPLDSPHLALVCETGARLASVQFTVFAKDLGPAGCDRGFVCSRETWQPRGSLLRSREIRYGLPWWRSGWESAC